MKKAEQTVVADYRGQQGVTNDELAQQLQRLSAQVRHLNDTLNRVAEMLEEKDARRRNRIIRQRIPARFMRESLNGEQQQDGQSQL